MRIWKGYDDIRDTVKVLKTLSKYGEIPDQLIRDVALNTIFCYRGCRQYWFQLLEKELPFLIDRFIKIYKEELTKTGKDKEELEKK